MIDDAVPEQVVELLPDPLEGLVEPLPRDLVGGAEARLAGPLQPDQAEPGEQVEAAGVALDAVDDLVAVVGGDWGGLEEDIIGSARVSSYPKIRREDAGRDGR